MSDRFPGLGFDPAPGDPEEVRLRARQHARVAAELDEVAAQVSAAGDVSSTWQGAAATAFAAAVAALPGQLRTAAGAFGTTAARLTTWALALEELQVEARAIERTASDALDRMRAAHAVAGAPSAGRAGGSPSSVLVGGGLHVVDVAEAEEDLRRATWAADEVRSRWRAGGRGVAAAVEAASAAAPRVPESLGEWVWQHRRGISGAADLCSVASLPVSTIPLVGAPIAAVLGAASTAGQAALAAYAGGSSTDVVLGALGVGLGGASMLAAPVLKSPVSGAVQRGAARGLQVGDLGYSAVGTAMTVHTRTAGPAQAPAPGAGTEPRPAPGVAPPGPAVPAGPVRPSPALQRLLVAPVVGEPERP